MFLADVAFVASGNDLRAPLFPGDCLFSGLLLLAMSQKCNLHSELPLSPGFIESVDEISKIIDTWYPEASAVQLSSSQGSPAQGEIKKASGVGCFFSGGVDSFYSLMRHKDEITHLIFIHGFDIPLHKKENREVALVGVYRVAEALGMEVIEVSTDIRYLGDQLAFWGYYGIPVLMASSHLLSGVLGKVYLPASRTYSQLEPYYSHPYVDPMWSTGELQIVHDGACADRAQKCEAIAEWDLALQHLRVCWELEGELNCGVCEKCTRTAMAFDLVGKLDKCSVFSSPYQQELLTTFTYDFVRLGYLEEALMLARKYDNGELVAMLEEVYALIRGRKTAEELHLHFSEIDGTDSWGAVSRSVRPNLFAYIRENDPEWLIKKTRQTLPQMRELLFLVFWDRCRRWLFRSILRERWMRSLRHVIPGLRRRGER
ncbi:MAG: hypothetical protein GY899_00470 [Verrucomicrobiaceae bacterium]|nr:hypothetical protein [Verrucomicrobiaceae bacterium]